MIVRSWIAQCHVVASCFRHAHFHLQDVLHLLLCSIGGLAHQLEHLHHMLFIGFQNLLIRLIVFHIVVALYRVATLRKF